MHAISYQEDKASTGTLSVLKPHDAEECKSSEATRLPVAWRPPLRHKTRAAAVSVPPKDKLPVPRVDAESPPVFDEPTDGDLDDHLVCVRVEKAKNLLLNPHYYFSEIAAELGFESLGQFNLAFKRWVGESPHAYRARLPARMGWKIEVD